MSNPIDAGHPLHDSTALARVVSRQAALDAGYSRSAIEHRLRAGSWRRILPRTYLTSDTLTWPDRVDAALTFAGPGALLSGPVALLDIGLRSVRRPATVLVLVPRSATMRSTAWVRIRRTGRMPDPAQLPGPRRAPVARAVADLCLESRRLDEVRTVVAQAVRGRLCTIDEIAVELECGPRNGSGHLRTALTDVSQGAWSAPEARAARALRAAGLGGFEQNVLIHLPRGRVVIVDFLWRGLRAVLEIDSVEHHLDPVDWRRTQDRHLALTTAGYSVVHRTPRDVGQHPVRFCAEVGAWLASLRRLPP